MDGKSLGILSPTEDSLALLAQHIARHLQKLDSGDPRLLKPSLNDDQGLRRLLREVSLETGGLTLDEAMTQVVHGLTTRSLHTGHPRHLGYANPSPSLVSTVGDALAAAFDPQLAMSPSAPFALALERDALGALASAAQLPSDPDASHCTTGASESLFTALAMALTRAEPRYLDEGILGFASRPRVYASHAAHRSLAKCLRMLGLGDRSGAWLRSTRADGVLDGATLAHAIDEDIRSGFLPLAVVATAGSTESGGIDKIDELVHVGRARGLWLHVDAAWGGGAALSQRGRDAMFGAHQADSFAWDAHKWPGNSLATGMLFTPHRELLQRLFGVQAAYMAGGLAHRFATTVQWSRRATGLKLWLMLATEGIDGLRARCDKWLELGDFLRAWCEREGVEVAETNSVFPVILLAIDNPAGRVRRVRHQGIGWVSTCEFQSRTWVRVAVTSPRTTREDLDAVLAALTRG
ncbi:MAG: pyridoxal-dependent decarboxylase [Deltaproteobacteria bacterium]|nr:pyridoxal-dependent decarboxylase [Deltaproteobacteria bacterium]